MAWMPCSMPPVTGGYPVLAWNSRPNPVMSVSELLTTMTGRGAAAIRAAVASNSARIAGGSAGTSRGRSDSSRTESIPGSAATISSARPSSVRSITT